MKYLLRDSSPSWITPFSITVYMKILLRDSSPPWVTSFFITVYIEFLHRDSSPPWMTPFFITVYIEFLLRDSSPPRIAQIPLRYSCNFPLRTVNLLFIHPVGRPYPKQTLAQGAFPALARIPSRKVPFCRPP